MKRLLLLVALVLASIFLGFLITSFLITQEVFEPRVITEQETVYIRTVEYVELPAEIVYRYVNVPVKVEVEVEVPQELRLFKSANELAEFLSGYSGNLELLARNEYLGEDNDCDDFAPELMEYARENGFDIVWETRSKGTWWNGERLKTSHMFNAAIIGNEVYFIDSATLEYWKRYQID